MVGGVDESSLLLESLELDLADVYLGPANLVFALLPRQRLPAGGRGGDEVDGVVATDDGILDETASVRTKGERFALARDVLKTRAVGGHGSGRTHSLVSYFVCDGVEEVDMDEGIYGG